MLAGRGLFCACGLLSAGALAFGVFCGRGAFADDAPGREDEFFSAGMFVSVGLAEFGRPVLEGGRGTLLVPLLPGRGMLFPGRGVEFASAGVALLAGAGFGRSLLEGGRGTARALFAGAAVVLLLSATVGAL